MKKGRILYVFLFGLFLMSSCFEPPVLPPEPSIKLKSYEFKPSPIEGFDSLIIEVNFEDGDGDLGLTTFDTIPPYNDFYFYVDDDGNLIKYDSTDSSFPPFSCVDYEPIITTNNDGTKTVEYYYVLRNEDHYNFFLDFYVKNSAGDFEKYDFLVERCGPDLQASPGFNGRFFPLNSSGKTRPLEGILRYGIQSGFKFLFTNKTLKLRIQIQDRALHKSNVVWTKEFTLDV